MPLNGPFLNVSHVARRHHGRRLCGLSIELPFFVPAFVGLVDHNSRCRRPETYCWSYETLTVLYMLDFK